jgi:hypothetical protein
VGRACGTHEREKCTRFWQESPKERDNSEDQGVGGRMASEWILGKLTRGLDWIRLAQDRNRWWAVVSAVMNLRVLVSRSYSLPSICPQGEESVVAIGQEVGWAQEPDTEARGNNTAEGNLP